LLIENPNLFSSIQASILSQVMHLENIPYAVLSVLNNHPSAQIFHAAQCHVDYAGEVKNDEDYTKNIRGLMYLQMEELHKIKLHEAQIYPRFFDISESKKIVWSPEEVRQEGIRCGTEFQSQVLRQRRNLTSWKEGDFHIYRVAYDYLMQLLEIPKGEIYGGRYSQWTLDHPFVWAMMLLYYNKFEYRGIDWSIPIEPEEGFFMALNPCVPIEHLEKLACHVNRYVRATARAVLQHRVGKL
jgi:hypothetical protein